MGKNKLLNSIIFMFSASFLLSAFFPCFLVNHEGVYQFSIQRITVSTDKIDIISSLFGGSTFGFSFVTIIIVVVSFLIITAALFNIFENKKWLTISLMLLSLFLFCLLSAQNILYATQYGIKTFNYLAAIKDKYYFITSSFEDTYLLKEAFYIDYGPGAYLAMIISSLISFLSFVKLISTNKLN